jgi:DNA polymerase
MIAIDFETYYDTEYSLKTLGPDAYCSHPLFDPYMVSVVGEGVRYCGPLSEAPWAAMNGRDVCAHNARFDKTVFLAAQTRGLIPPIRLRNWFCTADLAVFFGLPRSLKGAAECALGITMSKDMRDRAKGLHADGLRAAGLWERMAEYGLTDSEICLALFEKLSPEWPELERRISQLNLDNTRRGIAIDVEGVDTAIELMQTKCWEAEKRIPWATEGATILSHTPLRECCVSAGIPYPTSLAEDSPDCQAWEEEYGERYQWVAAMRDYRKANILLKKLATLKRRSSGGIFPYCLKYFGGHTGRFSGDSGLNMQNLPRDGSFGINFRNLFVARPGKILGITDLSQIEPRCLYVACKDTESLDLIRSGVSVYEAHAIRTLKWVSGDLKKLNPSLYALAKARVLALGYGAGGPTFKNQAANYGVILSPEEATKTVLDFRATSPQITGLWANFQRVLRLHIGGDMRVQLPSGRSLIYRNIQRENGDVLGDCGGRRRRLYGGILTENYIQAVARDVFCDRLLALHDAGFVDLVLQVHDEYVHELDIKTAAADLAEIKRVIAAGPEWFPGLPMDSAGELSPVYKK